MTRRRRPDVTKEPPKVAARYKRGLLDPLPSFDGVTTAEGAANILDQLKERMAQLTQGIKEAATKPIVRMQDDGSAAMVTPQPIVCGCGKSTQFLVNRRGVTRCIDCDEKAKAAQ